MPPTGLGTRPFSVYEDPRGALPRGFFVEYASVFTSTRRTDYFPTTLREHLPPRNAVDEVVIDARAALGRSVVAEESPSKRDAGRFVAGRRAGRGRAADRRLFARLMDRRRRGDDVALEIRDDPRLTRSAGPDDDERMAGLGMDRRDL